MTEKEAFDVVEIVFKQLSKAIDCMAREDFNGAEVAKVDAMTLVKNYCDAIVCGANGI